MEKLQSTFKNMVLSLVIISVVAAGALAGVYMLTLDSINLQKAQKQEAARQAVLAGQDGIAIETAVDGFGGTFRVMVGFDQEGNILGYEILEHQETPGLGSHMTHWFKNADKPGQNIIGRQATGAFAVSKDGGDVDAITAATISSRAFLKAINQAYVEFRGEDVEAHTGASQQQPKEETEEAAEEVEPCEHKCQHEYEHKCQHEGEHKCQCKGQCKHHNEKEVSHE